MVFFTCNGCNEALKKNKVEAHSRSCHACRNRGVSCVDCSREFGVVESAAHTSCVSEAAKYGAPGHVEAVPKGERKQGEWTERVQAAVAECQLVARQRPVLLHLLMRIVEQTNVPRKKAKFLNFVYNSMKCRDRQAIEQAWEMIEAGAAKAAEAPAAGAAAGGVANSGSCGSSGGGGGEEAVGRKKTKKQRREGVGLDAAGDEDADPQAMKKKRRREKNGGGTEVVEAANGEVSAESDEETEELVRPKFVWVQTATDILENRTDGLKLSRMKQKFMSVFHLSRAALGVTQSEEAVWSKYEQRLRRNSAFIVTQDRVRLRPVD